MRYLRHAAPRLLPALLLASLAGCAAPPLGPTVQVAPGPGKSFNAFQADNNECRFFAGSQVQGQAEAANNRAVGGAALATVGGAAAGALVGSAFGNAGAGAAIGAGAGLAGGGAYGANTAANAQMGIQQQYDNAYVQCMLSKGNRVPGYGPANLGPVVMDGPPVQKPDPMVSATQSELIRLGYLRDVADGFMGPRTRAAIQGYQQASGMPVDGAPSQRLLAKLQATPTSAGAQAAPPMPVAAPAAPAWVAPVNPAPAPPPAEAPAPPAGWVMPNRTN